MSVVRQALSTSGGAPNCGSQFQSSNGDAMPSPLIRRRWSASKRAGNSSTARLISRSVPSGGE